MSRPIILVASLIAALGVNAVVMAQSAPAASQEQITAGQSARQSAKADQPVIKPGDRNCLRHTGSLIPPKKGECMPAVGRSYSGDELRRTGAPNNARALQMLDPSISVGH
ncbi:hypothetical protein B0E47_03830 [Rhodanobacter sp. B05]|jgi:hypothetical protein|uniref:hypothetical protein n=1 Tax=Rhodanobacter sp. B05 TaxID=1945859 RepID=UPI0009853022|nr:hypothetical protein [Rhodanobacter sp. B05]OOG59173.1 hypothetical protein B0E47_03830 [Rhodanobacter sp. B05]